MKGLYQVIPLTLAALALPFVADAAQTVTSSAVWQVEAAKQTKTDLIITPVRALQLSFSPSKKEFNSDSGAFDIYLKGDHADATGFKLEARVDDSHNTLREVNGLSTIRLGASFNGVELGSSRGGKDGDGVSSSSEWTPLVDSEKNIGADGALWNLAQSAGNKYEDPNDPSVSARGNFQFEVKKATMNIDGEKTPVEDMSQLPDAYWVGEVAVIFRATWATP